MSSPSRFAAFIRWALLPDVIEFFTIIGISAFAAALLLTAG